jgi:replicative DNA helicase
MIIREKALLRSLIETCEEIIRLANHPAERNAVRILDIANSRIFNIHETFCLLGNQGQPKKLEEVVGQAMLRIGAHHHTEIRKYVTGLETGFGDLDQVTSGIQRGDMVFLASRPGMGGITLALNMVQHIGLNLGYPVLIFNLECRSTLIASQLLSSRTEIDFGKLQYGELSLKEVELLTIESERLSKSNIFIDDNTILRKISDLRTRILFTLRKCKGLGLIVIDSFQKLTDSICNEYSNIDSAALLRTIKDIAKEISVPIIVLSDLSRSLENRKNKRPQLKDLRKAGINCQEADMVLMLYRDEYYKLDSEDRGIAEVHIQKNKNGPTGVVYLKSRLEFCKFEPLSK